MIDEAQLRRLAAAGKPWAIDAVRDLEDDDAKQAEQARQQAARADAERVHELRLSAEPMSATDFAALNTGDVRRLDALTAPDGRRVQVVPHSTGELGHQGPWFGPAWLAPHLKTLPHAKLLELTAVPRLFEHLRSGVRGSFAVQDFTALVRRCQSRLTLLGVFCYEAPRGEPNAESRARLVLDRLRTLGVNPLEGDRTILADRVRDYFGLEIPFQISQPTRGPRAVTSEGPDAA